LAGIGPLRGAATAGHGQTPDPAKLGELVAHGKVVFVDVTAAWCPTCRVNEAAVLDREPIADRLHGPRVVAMHARPRG
jgi:suppressor for copper-sensitivity B